LVLITRIITISSDTKTIITVGNVVLIAYIELVYYFNSSGLYFLVKNENNMLINYGWKPFGRPDVVHIYPIVPQLVYYFSPDTGFADIVRYEHYFFLDDLIHISYGEDVSFADKQYQTLVQQHYNEVFEDSVLSIRYVLFKEGLYSASYYNGYELASSYVLTEILTDVYPDSSAFFENGNSRNNREVSVFLK
jgi:hypothetical protein